MGYKGVFISRTCFLDAVAINFLLTSFDAGLLEFTVTNAFAVTGICQWAVIHSKKKSETEVNAMTLISILVNFPFLGGDVPRIKLLTLYTFAN